MAPTAGVLVKSDIVKAGGITLQGDSVDLGSIGTFGTTLISNGGTILVRATSNDIKLGDLASSALLKANGGNVQLLAEGSVTGGHGNEFIARAAGTVGSHAGGAIEITAGSTFSRLTPALTLPGGTVPPDLSVLGSDIAIENRVRNAATGVVVAAINGGTVDLNAGPVDARTTLNLSRGFIVFGADGGNSVELDGATFSVDSYKPIAYRTPSSSCLSALKNTTVRTGLGDVYAKKGAVVSIVYENGMVRVAALSGPGDVRVIAGGRTIALAPGQELLLADRQITSEESHPSDGVGRRNITHHDLGDGIVACISDISIVSMIQNAAHMRTLRKPASQAERAVLGQMIKTAAAIEHITRDRGRYEARPAVKRMDDRWTPVSFKR
jgi:hypothetical protein